jgi:hypothetical protein
MFIGHGLPATDERPLADTDLEKLDLIALKGVNSLQDVRIINSTAIGIDLWKALLANQKVCNKSTFMYANYTMIIDIYRNCDVWKLIFFQHQLQCFDK